MRKRYRKPRFIILKTVEEIVALPDTSVIQIISRRNGLPIKTLERLSGDKWFWPGVETPYTRVYPTWTPARLLYTPEWDKI